MMTSSGWQSPVPGAEESTMGERDGCRSVRHYTSRAEEYSRIRRGIGLVDYSYDGKFLITGSAAVKVLNRLNLPDVSRLPIHRMMSSFVLTSEGAVLCDAHIANLGNGFMMLTEGADPARVCEAIRAECDGVGGSAAVTDLTRERALIGLDGPFAWELLKDFIGMQVLGVKYLSVVKDQQIEGLPVTLYRAGRTGEYGYWLEAEAGIAEKLWLQLLEGGRPYDLAPCGFDAVDLCKLENRVVSMHREGGSAHNVLELNCRVMVSREKGEYVGRPAIEGVLESGLERRLVGVVGQEAAEGSTPVLSAGMEVEYGGTRVGELANVGHSPALGREIGVAFLDEAYACVGITYEARAGSAVYPVRTVSCPFILNRSLTLRPQEDSYFNEDKA